MSYTLVLEEGQGSESNGQGQPTISSPGVALLVEVDEYLVQGAHWERRDRSTGVECDEVRPVVRGISLSVPGSKVSHDSHSRRCWHELLLLMAPGAYESNVGGLSPHECYAADSLESRLVQVAEYRVIPIQDLPDTSHGERIHFHFLRNGIVVYFVPLGHCTNRSWVGQESF